MKIQTSVCNPIASLDIVFLSFMYLLVLTFLSMFSGENTMLEKFTNDVCVCMYMII